MYIQQLVCVVHLCRLAVGRIVLDGSITAFTLAPLRSLIMYGERISVSFEEHKN